MRRIRLPQGWPMAAFGLLAGILLLIRPVPVYSATPVVLDGAFLDWDGQPCVSDPRGDTLSSSSDLINFCFTTNPNDPTAYFMAERPGGSQFFYLRLRIDTDNDGLYNEINDRELRIDYDPHGNLSNVWVNLYAGSGQFLTNIADNLDWGDGNPDGGRRVEWGVAFAFLGISPGQPVRMLLETYQNQLLSDSSGEIQWSPANALGWLLLGLLLAGGSFWFSRLQAHRGGQPC